MAAFDGILSHPIRPNPMCCSLSWSKENLQDWYKTTQDHDLLLDLVAVASVKRADVS